MYVLSVCMSINECMMLLALHYMRCDLYPFSRGKAVAAAKPPLAHTLYILFLLRLRFLVNQQPTPFLSLFLHPAKYPFCSSVADLFP